eukprot:c11990_g1_i1.p1 GENE.c11990_g1_i1~~c11990_g1_i1.p1  ORF type:complete len:282 (-),score=91.78 c11990_g1_i1:45-890(-)
MGGRSSTAVSEQAEENMAIGKNKRLTKSKKGAKGKKIIDPFKNKHKYDVKAPSYFANRDVGNTIVTKTTGTKIASDNLKGRVYLVNLADLKGNEEHGHTQLKLRAEDVQDRRVLTNFYGLQLTTDKLRSLVRKWQTLIEADVDVKTADGFVLRVFVIGFTAKRANQAKKTYYAQSSQIRQIRKIILDIVKDQVSTSELKNVVEKFVNQVIEKEIEVKTRSVYPMQNIFVRKVKVLRTPKFDLTKLMEVHGDSGAPAEDAGTPAPEPVEPQEAVVGDEPAEE